MTETRTRKVKSVFNLLKPKQPPRTSWDKFYDWLLQRARIVLFIAQIAIITVFGAKVLVDLQAKLIEDQITEIDQKLDFEYAQAIPRIAMLQQQTSSYAKLWENSYAYAGIVREIDSYIDESEVEIEITINANEMNLTGIGDRTGVAELEQQLKQSDTFRTVELYEIKSEGSQVAADQGGFGIRVTFPETTMRQLPNN